MTIWLVSREYAGIAEAGGVKNVACSLSENLVKLGHRVILFIPLYGCTDKSRISKFNCAWHKPVQFCVGEKLQTVTFSHGFLNGVEVVFVCAKPFSEKLGVYTYTKAEELKNSEFKKGSGHKDSLFLNTLFQKAVIAYGDTCLHEEAPQIIHCQDATTALIPSFLAYKMSISQESKSFYEKTKCVVTVHNAGPFYHHEFQNIKDAQYFTGLPLEMLEKGLLNNTVEPFLLALENSKLTTVSPEYANEIMNGTVDTAGLTEAFAERGATITGITNGIDLERYDPCDTTKSLLPASFNPSKKDFYGKYECRRIFLELCASLKNTNASEDDTVEQYGYLSPFDTTDCTYIAYHGRVVYQKGIDVLVKAAHSLLEKKLPVKFIFIGQGQPDLEKELLKLSLSFEGRCVFFRGYDRMLSRLCIASSDFVVLPSYFEPCGLEDFIAQIYGTLPVAHATGGLCKIIDDETGFLYSPNKSEKLEEALYSLVKIKSSAGGTIFNNMISYAAKYVKENYSWEKVALKYEELYKEILQNL